LSRLACPHAYLDRARATAEHHPRLRVPARTRRRRGASRGAAAPRVILARVDVAQGVLWVLAITAVGALLPLVPAYSRRWSAGLAAQHNYGRWLEFSFTSSIIVFLLAQLNGIRDIAALVAIYSLNSAMILFGWLQERYESPASRRGGAGLLPYIFGCIVGIVPWGIIAWYVIEPGSGHGITTPIAVQIITLVMLALFTGFAVGQWLQYKRVGRFADYLYGERAFLVWTFVTKTAFALLVVGTTVKV
jgi:hypothetical protein